MLMNADGAQFGGRIFLMGAGYALISLFVAGPLIGQRMVDKMAWGAQCQQLIHDELSSAEPATTRAPRIGCDDLMGTLFGREGSEFCSMYGSVIDNNPITQSLDAAENAEREAQRKRREFAVSRASTRCDCAITTTLEERRVPLAIYGGSARLITPPSVHFLASDLEANLNSPDCAMKG